MNQIYRFMVTVLGSTLRIYHVTALSTCCQERRLKRDIPNDWSSLVPMTASFLIKPPRHMLTCTFSKYPVPQEKPRIIPISRVSLQRQGWLCTSHELTVIMLSNKSIWEMAQITHHPFGLACLFIFGKRILFLFCYLRVFITTNSWSMIRACRY